MFPTAWEEHTDLTFPQAAVLVLCGEGIAPEDFIARCGDASCMIDALAKKSDAHRRPSPKTPIAPGHRASP